MPVDTQHPTYKEWGGSWTKCRHAFDGPKSIKAPEHRGTYLPVLEEQMTDEYSDYVERAQWFPATERTTKGLAGAVLRTDTQVEVPSVMEDHLEDVTLTGIDFHGFANMVLPDQILMGRCGGLVEMPEEESTEQRPYWTFWAAENIINWSTRRVFGRQKLVMVVLREERWVHAVDDPFTWKLEPFYRVLELVTVGIGDLRYRQAIWVKKQNVDGTSKEEWILDREIWPMRAGVLLEEIPFTFFGATSTEPKVQKPPMLDLVELNLGLYRNSADYEGALTAIRPVWALSGYPAGTSVVLGPRRALVTERPANETRAQILQGADPVGIRNAMEEKRKDLAVAGGRILEAQPTTNETAQAVKMRHTGDEATMRTISGAMGRGLETMLQFHAMWMGANPEEAEVRPNQDFISAKLTPQEIQALQGLLQNGDLSYQTFYHLMAEGETVRPGVDWEAELEQIQLEEEQELLARDRKAEEQRAAAAERMAAIGSGDPQLVPGGFGTA
jgi:hypothetical protein